MKTKQETGAQIAARLGRIMSRSEAANLCWCMYGMADRPLRWKAAYKAAARLLAA